MWGPQSIKGTMTGIGAFVVLLLVVVGIVGYVATRPPDKDLDAADRTWIREFETWTDTTERRVEAAIVGLTFESNTRNARLLEPLATCSASLLSLGASPAEILDSAHEAAQAACGRAEHAVGVNDAFGTASLATTRLHLDEAGDQLRLVRRNLREALGEATSA